MMLQLLYYFSTGLEPGHTYQFRVKALNEEGESEPLETDHGILAKNPYDVPGKYLRMVFNCTSNYSVFLQQILPFFRQIYCVTDK